MAALDRALEKRLGEFDRAFMTRRADLEGRLSDAEGRLADAIENGVADFKRAASGERRLLHEESAAQLAELSGAARQHLQELDDAASTQLASLRQVIDRVHELERSAVARIRDLGERVEDPGVPPRVRDLGERVEDPGLPPHVDLEKHNTGPGAPRRGDGWVSPRQSGRRTI